MAIENNPARAEVREHIAVLLSEIIADSARPEIRQAAAAELACWQEANESLFMRCDSAFSSPPSSLRSRPLSDRVTALPADP